MYFTVDNFANKKLLIILVIMPLIKQYTMIFQLPITANATIAIATKCNKYLNIFAPMKQQMKLIPGINLYNFVQNQSIV